MTNHEFRSAMAAALTLTALSVTSGCADLSDVDERASHDGEPHAREERPAELAQQFVPPSNAGELSGDHIKIESITASGSGCPKGSWTADKVPEGNAFTLTFEKYVIEAPASSTPTKTTLDCTLSLKLQTPKDLSYAVTSFQYFGYANLSAGMKASLDASYAFAGSGVSERPAPFHYDFPVPYETTYAVNDDVEARGAATSYSPCDVSTTLTIRTRLTLENAGAAPGILAMDNTDARARGAMKVNVFTRGCPGR